MTTQGKGGRPTVWIGGGGYDLKYLQTLGVAQLRSLFEEVYGERTQSNNSVWLRKKLSQPRDDSVGAGKRLLANEDETNTAKHSNVSDERPQTSGEPNRPQRASRSTVAKTEQLQQLQDEQQAAAGTGPLFAGASGTAGRWDMGATNGKGPGQVRGSHSYSNTPHSRVHQHTDDSDTSARSLIGLQGSKLQALAAAAAAISDDPAKQAAQRQPASGAPGAASDDAYAPAPISRLQPELQGREVWLYSGAWCLAIVTHVDMAQHSMWVQQHDSGGGGSRCLAGPELQHLLSHGHLALATPGPLVQQPVCSREPGRAKRPRSPGLASEGEQRGLKGPGRGPPGGAARVAYAAGMAAAGPPGYPPYPHPGPPPAWSAWSTSAPPGPRPAYPYGAVHPAPYAAWDTRRLAGPEAAAWWQPYYPSRPAVPHDAPPAYDSPSPRTTSLERHLPPQPAAAAADDAPADPGPREAPSSSSSRHLSGPGAVQPDTARAASHRLEAGACAAEAAYYHRQAAGPPPGAAGAASVAAAAAAAAAAALPLPARHGMAAPAPGPGPGLPPGSYTVKAWHPEQHPGLPPGARPALAAPLPVGMGRPMAAEPAAWAYHRA